MILNKLARYLKPFWIGLVLSFVLLFGQAMSDLNLPNFMSDIVNVGIQQSGIENAAPEAISQTGMTFIQTFMTEDEKALVNEQYALVSGTDKNVNGKTYESIYPNADAQQIYILSDDGKDALENLNLAFGNASWSVINVLEKLSAQTGQAIQNNGDSADLQSVDLDLEKLYALQPMLGQIPPSVFEEAHDKAAATSTTMLKQTGITFAKGFYEELGANISGIQSGYIIKIGLLMLLIALLGGVATILVGFISSRIAAGVSKNLRRDIFNKVESFSSREMDKFSTASLITRSTNDITQIQQFLMIGIRMLCYAPIMCIGGIIMAVGKSASMSWIIALAGVLLIGIIIVIFSVAMPKFRLIQTLVDRLNLVSRENLSGLMVIRAFGTREFEKDRFDKANIDLTKAHLFVNRVMVFMMPAMMLIMNGITLLVVWIGAHQISQSAIQVGDMMAFMQYAMQIIMSFLMVSMIFIFAPRAAVSAVRISEVLETEPTIVDPKTPKAFDPAKKGVVELKNVNFRYENAEEDALQNISFVAKPGETTAIIGSTGSGKSTIANLILRFYDVTGGSITVDGVDVREVKQKDLRASIGYVPQKGVLLSGTIESNLKYGNKQASLQDVETAAKVAQAIDFIGEKPERFEAPIAQGGGNVSGGQKQRLSIARALVKKPEIYIFDDSFSALDYKTDVALRKALKEHTGDSTIIIVAQRVSTIMHADQILVLDEGRIVGRGTHKELLKTCPEYIEIASSQLTKEELA